jgi:hypothetical protein
MPAAFGTVKCAKKPATETTKMLRDKFKFGLALCQEIEEFAKMIEVRTVFRILIQLYVSIKMKENESKSK